MSLTSGTRTVRTTQVVLLAAGLLVAGRVRSDPADVRRRRVARVLFSSTTSVHRSRASPGRDPGQLSSESGSRAARSSAERAASRRATGTRYGEHET
jgi:hypothetical protein